MKLQNIDILALIKVLCELEKNVSLLLKFLWFSFTTNVNK